MIDILAVLCLLVILNATLVLLFRRKLKVQSRSRRAATLIGCALIALLFASALTYEWMRSRTFQLFGGLVTRVETDKKLVALTFDDGPGPGTAEVMDVLRSRNAKATFFVIGKHVANDPNMTAKIVREGHELGNHSYTHQRMIFRSAEFMATEIDRTDALVRQAGQKGPIHFRPPNAKRLLLLPWLLSQRNKRTIYMDVEPDSHSGVAENPRAITEHVLARVKPGSIILLHAETSSRKAPRAAVVGIIDGLQSQGFQLVTVRQLLQRHQR